MYLPVYNFDTKYISLKPDHYFYYVSSQWSPVSYPPLDGLFVKLHDIMEKKEGILFNLKCDNKIWYVDDLRTEPLEIKAEVESRLEWNGT